MIENHFQCFAALDLFFVSLPPLALTRASYIVVRKNNA